MMSLKKKLLKITREHTSKSGGFDWFKRKSNKNENTYEEDYNEPHERTDKVDDDDKYDSNESHHDTTEHYDDQEQPQKKRANLKTYEISI